MIVMEKIFDETIQKKSGMSVEEQIKMLIKKSCGALEEIFLEEAKPCFAAFDVPERIYQAFITITGKKSNWRLRVDMKVIHTDRLFSNYIAVGDHNEEWIIEQLRSEEAHEKMFQLVEFLRDRLDKD